MRSTSNTSGREDDWLELRTTVGKKKGVLGSKSRPVGCLTTAVPLNPGADSVPASSEAGSTG